MNLHSPGVGPWSLSVQNEFEVTMPANNRLKQTARGRSVSESLRRARRSLAGALERFDEAHDN